MCFLGKIAGCELFGGGGKTRKWNEEKREMGMGNWKWGVWFWGGGFPVSWGLEGLGGRGRLGELIS